MSSSSISEHLPQSIIIENGKGDKLANKTAKPRYRHHKSFEMDSFKLNLQDIDWTFATQQQWCKSRLWSFSTVI